MKNLRTKTLLCLLLAVMCISVSVPISTAFATENTFETSNVLADLKSADNFDITDYPFDETGKQHVPGVINVVEYCYSFKSSMQDNYGLYLYFYNPQCINIVGTSNLNKVQIATKYTTNAQGEKVPSNYEKFDLKFCNMSTDANYFRLFYKFKVVDHISSDGKTILQRVNSNERRYDISGIELLTSGSNNATEYGVSGTYKFTGYAKGYGADETAECNLDCKVKQLETVTLDVKHTYYRTLSSSKGAGYQNQVDTAYFAVPKRLFDTYGTLQRIKAEWYEYKTKDIVITSNQDFYNKALPYVGAYLGYEYNSTLGISLGQGCGDGGGGLQVARWGWNLGQNYLHNACETLHYLFKTSNISAYDPYGSVTNTGGVESNALYDYILNYNKSASAYLPIKDGRISADMFESDIDDYRKMDNEFGKIQNGYCYYDFDAEVDIQKLSSYKDGNPSFWDNWTNWGLWNAIVGNIPEEESRTICPIYTLKATDFNGSDSDISDRLLIKSGDVSRLRAYYNDAKNIDAADDEEKVVVLFRFATTDYFSTPVDIVEINGGFLWNDKFTSGQAYRAQESVFLDFDIIQLTFLKDGFYTVIPAVSSPLDIVNDITPPYVQPDLVSDNWWESILGIVLLILLLVVLFPILPYVARAIAWAVCLPFKGIKAIFSNKNGGKRQ